MMCGPGLVVVEVKDDAKEQESQMTAAFRSRCRFSVDLDVVSPTTNNCLTTYYLCVFASRTVCDAVKRNKKLVIEADKRNVRCGYCGSDQPLGYSVQ